MADQYVIVTYYIPKGYLHVYGSWDTRAKAGTEVARMKRNAARMYPEFPPEDVTYKVRKVLTEPPSDSK